MAYTRVTCRLARRPVCYEIVGKAGEAAVICGRMTKQELVAAIRADREVWRSLAAEVGRDRMNEPGPMGQWTFKDLAGHLAGWRNWRSALLEAAARGKSTPSSPWPAAFREDDDINDWIREHDRDRSADDLVADYDRSFERLAAAIDALPEATLRDPRAFAWTDGEAFLDGDPTEHLHGEHLPAVRAWLAARSAA
jgi:hypothetical protein